METRREFLKKSIFLCGSSIYPGLFFSIEKALAIEPDSHRSYMEEAEHVVILMQENRSFDHIFGSMKGVRGFEDPRAISLPNGNPVWLQQDEGGTGHIPFHVSIQDTNITWTGSLPHSWVDQTEARNNGSHDRWIPAKASDRVGCQRAPLTMGFYQRSDLPFYYALADAFTICDQNFCSSLTGTTPNRLYLLSGTIREKPNADSPAKVLNSDVSYDSEVAWTTFPERLEQIGVSWKLYQNELSFPSGLTPEEDDWLSNFTNNPLEWFTQYHVQASQGENPKQYEALSEYEKNLHEKAFCTNRNDPFYRQLTEFTYEEAGIKRELQHPKGDVLHQFREDVSQDKLPQVSWLVPPANFSDHPGAPWYGAWYVSQVLEILTENPEVWKKTIFILTYDENDGYFDHAPPFTPPHPTQPQTGLVSAGLDVSVEYAQNRKDVDGPIGLGFRVPMIIASPWTRGGCVCSEVFDHTSILQFLEKFLTQKMGKEIKETNISAWRRTVCGDLTSAFQVASAFPALSLPFLEKYRFLQRIHQAKYQDFPKIPHSFTEKEMELIRRNSTLLQPFLSQEKGMRPSAPLPYFLFVDGNLEPENQQKFKIQFTAGEQPFSKKSTGSPFIVYAFHTPSSYQTRNYAACAGDSIKDGWDLTDFENSIYRLRVLGPNGFFREFQGYAEEPRVSIFLEYEQDHVRLRLINLHPLQPYTFEIKDCSYGEKAKLQSLPPQTNMQLLLPTHSGFGWYDIQIQITGHDGFFKRFAGRVETGKWGYTDPLIGRG